MPESVRSANKISSNLSLECLSAFFLTLIIKIIFTYLEIYQFRKYLYPFFLISLVSTT